MASGYGEESVLRDVPQNPNEYLDTVIQLHQHYVSEMSKLEDQLSKRAHENIRLSKKLEEIREYVNSVLNQDGPQPG